MTPESTPLATPVASPFATPEATPLPLPIVEAPSGGGGFPWVDVLGIVLLSALLWTGLRKIELSGYWKGILALLDIGLLVYAVVGLGWSRALVFVVGANAIFFLAKWAWFLIQYDDVLTHAGVAASTPKSEMKVLADRLSQSHRGLFNYMSPMRKARLICHLSERKRTVPEIESMAPPIAMLWVMDRPDIGKFVGDFDRLMRLWDLPATAAMTVANRVTGAYKVSPMTTQEVIDAMIAFAEAFPGSKPADYPMPQERAEED